MPPYCFTRLLYPVDEVCLSLLTALVDQRSLDECYFWATEIYESGFGLIPYLWTIYLDFYCELNPKLEGFIRRRWHGRAGLREACAIVRNLHKARPCATVFVIRQALSRTKGTTKAYAVDRGKSFARFPSTHALWLDAIQKRDPWASAEQLYALSDTWCTDSLFQVLMAFHSEVLGAHLKASAMERYWSERPGTDDLHHLLAIMIHLWRPKSELKMRKVFVAPSDDALRYQAPPTPFCRPDRLLARARLFPIDPGIGVFELARNSVPSPLDALRNHWEYYAYRCPLWRERIDELGGKPNHETHTIDFRSDEALEAFYGLFGLEPDELPSSVQRMSTHAVSSSSAQEWAARSGVPIPEAHAGDAWQFTTEIDSRVRG